jgi:hypothetical protein
MSRLVELKRVPRAGELEFAAGEDKGLQERIKEYGERVAKFIPAEVLAFYASAVQLILTKDGDQFSTFRLVAFALVGVVAWVGTPFYLGMFSDNPKERRPNQIMGFVAFIIWAYAYPAGLFTELGWNDPVVAGLFLLFFTFFSGFYQPKEKVPADPKAKKDP